MIFLVVLVIQILVIFFTSKKIHEFFLGSGESHLYSTKIRYWLFSILFIPGTFLHELSHFIMAVILGVKVNSFNIVPTFTPSKIILGSVEIVQPGFIKRFLVGVAPLAFGFTILTGLIYIFYYYRHLLPVWGIVLLVFLVFIVSNTMFLSKKDLEGSSKFFIFILTVSIILFFIIKYTNLYINIDLQIVKPVFKEGILLLFFPVTINLIFWVLTKCQLRN